jgi:hypothetical protein
MKVKARDAEIAKVLKHQPTGIKFGADLMAQWPNDSFTRRRIRDGDITVVEEKEKPAAPQSRPTSRGRSTETEG